MARDNSQIAMEDMQQTIYKELGYKSYPFPFTTPAKAPVEKDFGSFSNPLDNPRTFKTPVNTTPSKLKSFLIEFVVVDTETPDKVRFFTTTCFDEICNELSYGVDKLLKNPTPYSVSELLPFE